MDKNLDSGKSEKTKEFYEFGDFRLDVGSRRLWRHDELMALTPKEFDVLFYLVKRAGRVVEKSELLDAIWADAFVEETTLARNVSWLRKKLGAGNDKLIETVPKRGYCFAAEVTYRRENETPLSTRNEDALAGENTAELIIEEQTVRHYSVEETIALAAEENFEKKLPVLPAAKSKSGKLKFLWLMLAVFATAIVSFAVYDNFFRQTEPRVVLVSRVAPFSGLPGREDMPAFSPDGKLVAFVWNNGKDEDLDVYVRMRGAGEPVRLTENESDDIRPIFSPDGKQIAFVRVLAARSEVLMIPALGGAERKICNVRRSSSSISFSPDGRFLAVHDADESDARPGIFLVNLENGEKRRLTAPPELTADDRPAFSPDGKQIAFIRNFAPVVQEIFVLPLPENAAEPRQITFDKTWIGGAAWSADGENIVFASRRKYNSQKNLWKIPASGGQAEVLATGGKEIGNLAVSPDAQTIAFVEESSGTNIWRIEPARLPARTAFRRFAASSGNSNSPNVSRDGSRVCFASNRTGNYEIWIADSDGSNVRQLTDLQNSPAGSPRFSPDGKWIAFDAQIEGNGDIFVISAEGGEVRRVTDSPSFDFMPAWSADGKQLYFASDRGGAAQIHKIPATGGEARQITRNGGRESYESADGKQLFYSKNESGGGLWRIPTTGGDEQAVPELATAGYWRYWTATENGIYFVARSNYPPYKIMFYDFATNQATETAATDAFPIWVYPGLGAAPDGKAIFYTQSDQNASIIMLAELQKP